MSVSLCVLRIEIDEDLPEMGDNSSETDAAREQKRRDRGARESNTITVETYASVLGGPNTDTGILPTSSRISPPKSSSSDENETISFFCGNPLVEVTKGVLHLYKENELKEAEEAKTLCLLSVPGALGAHDLLAFAAACQQDIAHVRVLRDGSADHYMALLTFRSPQAAREFHAEFAGVPYSTLEPHCVCHMAWVARVEWARTGAAPPAHTELPICPVCLERMDESVAGVLSVQCAHAFHAECLTRWRDARCPVCRCAQVPEPRATAVCRECHAQTQLGEEEDSIGNDAAEALGEAEGHPETEVSSLWICLICGHVGCGRYEGGHAAKHFLASNHTYALQIGSNRVWDYAGDNFVHRLVQNKPDGKLVAAEGMAPDGACTDKLDAAQLDLTYTLTHQLDSQREYYEGKIEKMQLEHAAECEELRGRARAADAACAQLKGQVDTLSAHKHQLEKKLQATNNKLSTLASSLAEERGLASALAASQAQWQASAAEKEAAFKNEISELKEQLRDVMFFVEARGQLEQTAAASQHELAAASVTVAPAPTQRRNKRGSSRTAGADGGS